MFFWHLTLISCIFFVQDFGLVLFRLKFTMEFSTIAFPSDVVKVNDPLSGKHKKRFSQSDNLIGLILLFEMPSLQCHSRDKKQLLVENDLRTLRCIYLCIYNYPIYLSEMGTLKSVFPICIYTSMYIWLSLTRSRECSTSGNEKTILRNEIWRRMKFSSFKFCFSFGPQYRGNIWQQKDFVNSGPSDKKLIRWCENSDDH